VAVKAISQRNISRYSFDFQWRLGVSSSALFYALYGALFNKLHKKLKKKELI